VARNADIYVLALHSTTDDSADHRDPQQWSFFVVKASALPDMKRIGLSNALRVGGDPVPFEALAQTVASVRALISV